LPDSESGGSLETRLARAEQHIVDLDKRMSEMVPLTTNVVQLNERVVGLRKDVDGYHADIRKYLDVQDTREETERKERRDARRAFWALAVVIFAALIGAAAVLLSTAIR
jgi:hypothetical protein